MTTIVNTDGEFQVKVFSNFGKQYNPTIDCTLECEAEIRVEECHGYHTFYDIRETDYDLALQIEQESFNDLEEAEERVGEQFASFDYEGGERIIGFIDKIKADDKKFIEDLTSHILHD